MLKTIPEVVAQIKLDINTVSAVQAFAKLKAEDGIIIDVREPSEFNEKSASGTINIPRGLLEMKMLQMHPDENFAIFLHCATGARAVFATEQLQRLGYKNVSAIACMLDDVFSASNT